MERQNIYERKYLTRELRCVIMESMKRIDVLKGIEQILVQKAYEIGHISHRADGDWQKQADGSWIPYKGQSNQSTPQTQEPTTNNENVKMSPKQLTRHLLKNGDYDSAIKQIDFEEDDDGVPFTYDDNFELIVDNVMNDMGMSDEERKVNRSAVSRAIMDRALQLRKPAENTEYGEITEEDLVETSNEETRNSWIGSDDSNAPTKKGYEDFGFSEPHTKKQARKLIEDIADRLEQEYPNINDMLKNREHINGDFQREQEETVNDVMEKLGLKNLTDGDYYTRDAVESLYAKIHGHWYDEENSPQSDNADNNHEKYNINGDVRQKIKDLAYKYNAIYDNGDFDTEQTEDIMREVGLDPTDDSQLDAFSDVMYDIGHGVEKSAVRDMRSAPITKNMGF